MDYLALLAAQPGDHTALITDTQTYSYAGLVTAARALRRTWGLAEAGADKPRQRSACFIHHGQIAAQLLEFLACSGTEQVPVIATQASRAATYATGAIPDAACMGVLTSGTGGRSKLLWRSYVSWADFFPQQNAVFGLDARTRIFCQGSLAFTGNLSIYLGVFAVGGTVIATEKFSPKYWLARMEACGANAIYLIPAKLLLLPRAARGQNTAVRQIVSGSQSLGLAEAQRLRSILPQAELTLYYGASEVNYVTYIKAAEMTADRTLVGRPFPGVQVLVEQEEIFIVTPYAVEGMAMPCSLGDRGRLDAEGRLHFLGRQDDLCNVNGRKVSSAKVENALRQLLPETEVAVAVLHERDADLLTAFLAGGPKLSKQQLLRLLRPQLAYHEVPHRFIYLERLPRNASGKTDRRRLQKYADGGFLQEHSNCTRHS